MCFYHVLGVMFIRLGVMFCVYKLSCVFVHFVGYNHVKRSSWELWAKGDLSQAAVVERAQIVFVEMGNKVVPEDVFNLTDNSVIASG